MTADFRALCAELVQSVEVLLALRPAEARPLRTTEDRLSRARAALTDGPAVPDGREPATWTEGVCGDGAALLKDGVMVPIEAVVRELNEGAFARAVLARWGNPVPAPPVEGEWQTGLPSFAGFYYVRGLLNESIGGDNRPVYVNPKHFVWGFWEQDDPEWIGLDSDITPDNIQWKPVAPLPSPVADGEVAELVEMLKGIAYWRLHGKPGDKPTPFDIRQAARLTRAAELLERLSPPQPPVPVPVSERLPGPEDMTDDGEVWIEDPGHEYPLADAGDYDWDPHKWILRPIGKFDAQNGLRWLPAQALPLPGQEVKQ